jgi:hypothetical protein
MNRKLEHCKNIFIDKDGKNESTGRGILPTTVVTSLKKLEYRKHVGTSTHKLWRG